ncbi:MAG: hypothetical protein QNK37_03545 [Acidobacteriota bacterium]|nr:hypothetical protein [Acidobacteriota bacterium]
MAAHAFHFDTFRGDTDADTLAYWICLTTASSVSKAEDLDRLVDYMVRQFEFEGSCEQFGSVIPIELRKVLRPVAPVQLARKWSPIPDLVKAFGEPKLMRTLPLQESEQKALCAWWTPAAMMTGLDLPGGHGDRDRLARLFNVARYRAAALGSGVAVVVKQGWSYELPHTFSDGAVALMRRAGFIVTDRHA